MITPGSGVLMGCPLTGAAAAAGAAAATGAAGFTTGLTTTVGFFSSGFSHSTVYSVPFTVTFAVVSATSLILTSYLSPLMVYLYYFIIHESVSYTSCSNVC